MDENKLNFLDRPAEGYLFYPHDINKAIPDMNSFLFELNRRRKMSSPIVFERDVDATESGHCNMPWKGTFVIRDPRPFMNAMISFIRIDAPHRVDRPPLVDWSIACSGTLEVESIRVGSRPASAKTYIPSRTCLIVTLGQFYQGLYRRTNV